MVDLDRNSYCCPPQLVRFAACLWPDGIDRDVFSDPHTAIVSRDPYDIRRGEDVRYLEPFAPDRQTGQATRTVHANGPYTIEGQYPPCDWYPRVVRSWQRACENIDAELLTVSPLTPSARYWDHYVWNVGALAILCGRINFEINGKPTSGARSDVAMVWYGRDDRRETVRNLAWSFGWATAERKGA